MWQVLVLRTEVTSCLFGLLTGTPSLLWEVAATSKHFVKQEVQRSFRGGKLTWASRKQKLHFAAPAEDIGRIIMKTCYFLKLHSVLRSSTLAKQALWQLFHFISCGMKMRNYCRRRIAWHISLFLLEHIVHDCSLRLLTADNWMKFIWECLIKLLKYRNWIYTIKMSWR